MDNRYTEASKARLIQDTRKEITKMMEQSLDFAHVACPTENFKQLRSKILRAGNNCMRNIAKELDNYNMEYTKLTEEVIEFRHKG